MDQGEPTWREKAAAHLLEARRKNGRLGVKRSRAGCISCKERRVKCGEEKPECKRCLLAGRNCEGYNDSTSSSRGSSASPPIQQNPSLVLHVGDSQRRTYDFFLSHAAPRLAGPLDKDFWCGYILQLAPADPIVTDCLLAISILYEHPQFMASFRVNPYRRAAGADKLESLEVVHPNVPPPPDEFHSSALQKYNRAIRQFKDRVEDGSATPALVLTSCALFFCIEVIRDNFFAALSLMQHGVGLLEQYASTFSKDNQLLKTMRHMFSRIGVTAATVGKPLPAKNLAQLATVGHVSKFENMTDSRNALFAIMSESHDFMKDATAWKKAVISSNAHSSQRRTALAYEEESNVVETMYGAAYRWTNQTEIPARQTINTLPSAITPYEDPHEESLVFQSNAETGHVNSPLEQDSRANDDEATSAESLSKLRTTRLYLLDRLEAWLKVFQSTYDQMSSLDRESVAFLLMYYHVTHLWVFTRLNIANTIFDEFTAQFEQILHHAELFLSSQVVGKATFTFETGAVAPLFLTATCCRVPSLRRRALDMMSRAPRKESFHGAQSTAELACQAIAIEEEGLGHPLPDTNGSCANIAVNDDIVPAEDRRIHYLELMKNTTTQRHEIIVTRYDMVDGLFRYNIETFPI